MRTHVRAPHLLAAIVAGATALAGAGTAAADQGVARDVTEACEVASRSPFTDRPPDAFGLAVDCVASYRITTGVSAQTFGGLLPVTRGQMASFVVRTAEVAGLALPAPSADVFADDTGSVHEAAVNRVAAAGIAAGFPDGTFRPSTLVSRGQVATFVANLLRRAGGAELPAPTSDYYVDDAGSPHERSVNRLAEIGVVAGRVGGSFGAGDAVTRGQMALLLARGLDWLTEVQRVPLARTGLVGATAGPELVGAAATTTGPTTVVAFAFDEEVAGSGIAPEAFHAIAFDGTATAAAAATRDATDTRVVRATFPAREARLSTTVTVGRAAVRDMSGNPGPEGAAGLQPIELLPGTTAAPDLFSVTRLGATVVDFNFDEPAFVLRGTGYRLLLSDGTTRRSTAALGAGATTHTVTFPDLTGDDAARVVRAVIDAGTVSDSVQVPSTTGPDPTEGSANPQQAVAVAAAGSMAGVPDLVQITVDAGVSQLRYTFDEPVTVAAGGESRFRAYDLGARQVSGTAAARAGDDARSVVVTFAAGSVSGLIAGGSVDDAAVRSTATFLTNRADEVGLPRSFAPGETAAPDLVRVGRVQLPAGADGSRSGARHVVFQYDQPLTVVAPDAFSVHAPGGARIALTGCRLADTTAVVCVADAAADPVRYAAVGAATRAGVAGGAVSDRSGAFRGHAGSEVL